ncbi:hypothetical protein DFH09DRAFT_1229094, partial [Mycena vulgaris]
MAKDPPIFPAFPFDVERIILEMTALSRPVSIPALMLVAWRVKDWVEPWLYRTLVIGTDTIDGIPRCDMETFRRIARTKPPFFLRDSVRNLMVYSVPAEDAQHITSLCSAVENVYIVRSDDRSLATV